MTLHGSWGRHLRIRYICMEFYAMKYNLGLLLSYFLVFCKTRPSKEEQSRKTIITQQNYFKWCLTVALIWTKVSTYVQKYVQIFVLGKDIFFLSVIFLWALLSEEVFHIVEIASYEEMIIRNHQKNHTKISKVHQIWLFLTRSPLKWNSSETAAEC